MAENLSKAWKIENRFHFVYINFTRKAIYTEPNWKFITERLINLGSKSLLFILKWVIGTFCEFLPKVDSWKSKEQSWKRRKTTKFTGSTQKCFRFQVQRSLKDLRRSWIELNRRKDKKENIK